VLGSRYPDRAGDRVRQPLGQCGVGGSIAEIHLRGVLKERQEDLAFLDQRIEKGLVAKLEGIVGAELVHMEYGEAIQVLERANEKFEFPVKPTCPRLRPSTPSLRLG
jgi:hypothetical protein